MVSLVFWEAPCPEICHEQSTPIEVDFHDPTDLVTFAKTFEMLGLWSSYKNTHVGTIAQLELSLANSSATSFFPRKICKYLRPSKLFSNLRSS
jgi:hypothetical protein